MNELITCNNQQSRKQHIYAWFSWFIVDFASRKQSAWFSWFPVYVESRK